ncbi:MAG: NEW3 domain-containing protein, partial [Vicinamibacteria bacterium]
VRLERPEVIVTMWPGPGTHGQHQMAARAATIAFEKAEDPEFCPELSTREFLKPFTPLKLYYYDREGATSVSIPTGDYSETAYRSYAEVKALAASMYRSQGFDRLAKIPVEKPVPESFLLVRSRAPIAEPESHLLAGASREGIELRVEPETFETGVGAALEVAVTLRNRGSAPIEALEIWLEPPPLWNVEGASGAAFESVPPEQSASARFRIVPSAEATIDRNQRVVTRYRALRHQGENFNWVQARAPVAVRFAPLYDVADYQEFARETRTEWVIETLPTRVPLVIGRTNQVDVIVSNASATEAGGRLELTLPPSGITVEGPLDVKVPPQSTAIVPVKLYVDERALPGSRHSAKLPLRVRTRIGGLTSEDVGDAYALPSLTIPRARNAPRIDGDLSDLEGFARGEISFEDLWWRKKPDGPVDSSASFYLGYDSENLYAGVEVRDEVVVCN